ncbi:MAG: PAS domain S-box protein, partial [Longimicrobiales bacterium]
MSDDVGLTREAGGGGSRPDLDRLMGRDRTPQRATVYWVLLLVLAAGPFVLRDSPWRSGPNLHTVIETASTVLAFMAGALALVRFYSKKRSTYLFIGTGFLGTAILEAYHASISSGFFAGQLPQQLVDVTAWSWIGARLFLALFLFVSWLSWRRADWAGGAEGEEEGSVYLTTVLLTGLILGFVAFVPTRPAYYPDFFIHRPADLLPGIFFSLALGGYLWKGAWRRDPFEHWLVIALIVSAVAQIGYMPFSLEPNDWAYDAAHLLKVVSYGAVLTGILISVYVTFRREERALEQIQSTNDALAREVAVRRKAERVLQENEERLRDFLDNANDLIQTTAPDGEIRYVNRAWARTLGYSEEEATGRSMWDFVTPSARSAARRAFGRVLEGEPASGIEVEFVAADGRVVVCSGSSNCRFENGVPVTIRSIFRDVTEQRRVEREMAAAQANVEALVESTGDTIWSVDEKHRLIEFNTAFALSQEARTGREPQKGDHPAQIFRPDEVAWYRDQYDQALSGERFSVLRTEEFQGQTKNYEYFFNPIVEDRGIAGVVAFGRDVTRRILAEEALRLAKEEAEAANRAKTQFLANMSHELRTPLNSVIGFTNILLKNQGGNLADKQITFLERVLSNGRHLLTLINEVLDLAKVESGRMELEIEEVSLDKLVRDTLGQLEGQVRASKGDKVKLRPEIPERTAPLETDRAKLKQVIINLVGNALRFTEEGEVAVIVEASADGTAQAIHVQDTGIGIPEDRLEAIFEAFQQADSSTSRRYGGTGLGLTISRSICQMLGYELDVGSEVGVGSTFTIRLQPSATGRHEDRVREGEAAVRAAREGGVV